MQTIPHCHLDWMSHHQLHQLTTLSYHLCCQMSSYHCFLLMGHLREILVGHFCDIRVHHLCHTPVCHLCDVPVCLPCDVPVCHLYDILVCHLFDIPVRHLFDILVCHLYDIHVCHLCEMFVFRSLSLRRHCLFPQRCTQVLSDVVERVVVFEHAVPAVVAAVVAAAVTETCVFGMEIYANVLDVRRHCQWKLSVGWSWLVAVCQQASACHHHHCVLCQHGHAPAHPDSAGTAGRLSVTAVPTQCCSLLSCSQSSRCRVTPSDSCPLGSTPVCPLTSWCTAPFSRGPSAHSWHVCPLCVPSALVWSGTV